MQKKFLVELYIGDYSSPIVEDAELMDYFTINADNEILTSIKFGNRVKLKPTNICIDFKKSQKEKVFKKTNKKNQTKVLDINQNLIAIGDLLWEDELCYFQPSKVFI